MCKVPLNTQGQQIRLWICAERKIVNMILTIIFNIAWVLKRSIQIDLYALPISMCKGYNNIYQDKNFTTVMGENFHGLFLNSGFWGWLSINNFFDVFSVSLKIITALTLKLFKSMHAACLKFWTSKVQDFRNYKLSPMITGSDMQRVISQPKCNKNATEQLLKSLPSLNIKIAFFLSTQYIMLSYRFWTIIIQWQLNFCYWVKSTY